MASANGAERAALRAIGRQFPTPDAALAEIARLSAELELPSATIHVVSDVHGEDVKLRHVINNASGTLRPLVEQVLGERLTPAEKQRFLSLIFYPAEMLERLGPQLGDAQALRGFAGPTLGHLFEIVRSLGSRRSLRRVEQLFPAEYRELLSELLFAPSSHRDASYYDAIVDALVAGGRALHLIHLTVRVVRNLAVDEIIVAGDCFDRGPRADRVVDYLRRQPSVSFTWGNHDAAWIGACLGQEALIAHVLRVSLRYRRLSQLEEGYGITLQPLEHLTRTVYADDPADCFLPRGTGLRDARLVARMQKAAAILQFKLEGQTVRRHPEFAMEHRCLLHRIDHGAGTIEIDGKVHALRDRHFPTIDPADPYALSPEEASCMARIRESFIESPQLWEHVQFLVQHGAMHLVRDGHLVFHGCVPVDESGDFLAFPVDGTPRAGRALFEALDRLVVRALEERREADLDVLWYLWSGPRSPLFGKDRITTFERDMVADETTHEETKNAYFRLIHDAAFCERVLGEFDVDPGRGMIVNGHVPVKIEKGESPVKKSGKAVTIDGAFSEAYGDHGYTLLIDSHGTSLAMHHHFDSVAAAVRDGVDIVPTVSVLRTYDPPRRLEDGERGAELRAEIDLLQRLLAAYRTNELR